MKNRILNQFGLKVLSLVLAFVVWIIVANIDDYKTTKTIPGIEIEFINGEAITSRNKLYEVPEGTTIDIVVKGRRSVVETLSSEDFKAVADLSKISVSNAVAVQVSAVSNAVAKELTISYPDSAINVNIENKVEVQLPITVRTLSEVADGYAIRSKTATPNLIRVEGAESVIGTIAQVVVDVNVKRADHSLTAYAEPIFLNANGEVIDPSKFTYDVTEVTVNVEVLQTKTLSVKVKPVGEVKEGYDIASIDYQPTSVLVVGQESDLAKVEELVIDDIDVSGLSKDKETSVVIEDYLPSGITLAEGVEEIMIKIVIEEILEKVVTISADDINIVGKNSDYLYVFESGISYSFKVRGLNDKLESLEITNMIPSVDVTGYTPGTYSMTVSFREINGVTMMEPLVVKLVISERKD